MPMIDHRRVTVPALAAAALLFGLRATRAEVAVGGVGSSGSLRLYIMMSLVDDPEPVGIAWSRVGPDGSSRVVLNDGGYANGDGNPSLLQAPEAPPLVAWSRNSPQGYDVVISRFEDDAWTEPEVLAGEPEDELDPQLLRDPSDGSVHVVYWVDEAIPRVMHREAPADLSAWSVPIQVSEASEPSCRPSGAFHDGLLRVAYEIHDYGMDSTPRQIVLATWDGTAFARQMLSITWHPGPNRPEVHTTPGRMWVDWIDADDRMAWIRLLSSGWGTVQIEDFDDAEDRDFSVRRTIRSLVLH